MSHQWPLGRPPGRLVHSAALRLLALKRILLCPGHFVTIVTTHTHGSHYALNIKILFKNYESFFKFLISYKGFNTPIQVSFGLETAKTSTIYFSCGRVVTYFDWEAKTRCNF